MNKPERHREWSFDSDRIAEWIIVIGACALLVAFISGVRP